MSNVTCRVEATALGPRGDAGPRFRHRPPPVRRTVDLLTEVLLSHLTYEEEELVEPIERLGLLV